MKERAPGKWYKLGRKKKAKKGHSRRERRSVQKQD
mgnify:CR=1 FL=1